MAGESDSADGLNPMQRAFAEEFERTGHVTNSAIFAGYSPDTAHAQGSRLLKHVKVIEYRKELQKRAFELAGVTQERIVREMADIAFNPAYGEKTKKSALDSLGKWVGLPNAAEDAEKSNNINVNVDISLEEAGRKIAFALARAAAQKKEGK